MFPFAKKTYPSVIGTSEALMIVDMQERFLPDAKDIRNTEYLQARQNLISKVKNRIAYHMDKANDIILVSYINSGDTISEIEDQLKNYKPLRLTKNKDSLFHCLQNNRRDAIHGLQPLKNSDLEVVGVNASVCVLKTGASLFDHKFALKVKVDSVLNSLNRKAFDIESFRKFNKLSFLKKSYADFFGIYYDDDYFPERRDLSSLFDRELDFGDERLIWEL